MYSIGSLDALYRQWSSDSADVQADQSLLWQHMQEDTLPWNGLYVYQFFLFF